MHHLLGAAYTVCQNKAADMSDHLVKPQNIERLIRLINDIITLPIGKSSENLEHRIGSGEEKNTSKGHSKIGPEHARPVVYPMAERWRYGNSARKRL